MRAPARLLLFALVTLLSSGTVRAQLSPGPLSQAHGSLEGIAQCTRCHVLGEGVAAEKCLECHEAIRGRLDAKLGLHGRNAWRDCVACHSDHHGTEFALVRWEGGRPEALDHEQTGFSLRGRHADLNCRQCHRSDLVSDRDRLVAGGANPERTYLGLGTECAQCHRDPHRPSLGNCAACHDESSWAAPRFDHERTAYRLDGLHAEVPCVRCHTAAPASFAPLAHGQCSDCHRDPHRGDLGAQCARCHATTGWGNVTVSDFDHNRTRFPLRGAHVETPCQRCHASGRPVAGRLACAQCHRDPHGDQFSLTAEEGSRCERCHREDRFRPAGFGLTEHAGTDYPLTGAHRAVPCTACHGRTGQARIYSTARPACGACHADPHAATHAKAVGDVEACAHCHATNSWSSVDFTHDAVGFPLDGKHREARCARCHASTEAPEKSPLGRSAATERDGITLRFDGAPTACRGCHRDPHDGQFDAEPTSVEVSNGTACVRCHSTASWSADRFDHDRDARFPLQGAHATVPCASCHQPDDAGIARYRPLETNCISCHAEPRPAKPRHAKPRHAEPPKGTS